MTHPSVDADDGWQYATSFDVLDDQWSAEIPAPLERALSGSGMVAAGFGNPQRNFSASRRLSATSINDLTTLKWVRRRRWVRVMRRRIDIPPMPFLQPDGNFYYITENGEFVLHVEDTTGDEEDNGQELVSFSKLPKSLAQDYVSRARYLVGNQSPEAEGESLSALEARRMIAKLERATTELRQGIGGELKTNPTLI